MQVIGMMLVPYVTVNALSDRCIGHATGTRR